MTIEDVSPPLKRRNPSPFLSLPLELRAMVYYYFLYENCQPAPGRVLHGSKVVAVVNGCSRNTITVTEETNNDVPNKSFWLQQPGFTECLSLFFVNRQIYEEARDVFFRKIYGEAVLIIRTIPELQHFAKIAKANPNFIGQFADFLSPHIWFCTSELPDIKYRIQKWIDLINVFLRAAGKSAVRIINPTSNLYDCLTRAQSVMVNQLNSSYLAWPGTFAFEHAQIHHSLGCTAQLWLGRDESNRWAIHLRGDIGRLSGLWNWDEDTSGEEIEDELEGLDERMASWLRALDL
jgi:hypothetical protein